AVGCGVPGGRGGPGGAWGGATMPPPPPPAGFGTPSAAAVFGPTTPSALRPLRCWNVFSACDVFGPNAPSVDRRGTGLSNALSLVCTATTELPLLPICKDTNRLSRFGSASGMRRGLAQMLGERMRRKNCPEEIATKAY